MSKKKEQKTTEELLVEISISLNRIAYALILPSLKGKSQQDQVDFLSKTGFSNNEIAQLVGSKPNIVRATISNLRKKQSKDEASENKQP